MKPSRLLALLLAPALSACGLIPLPERTQPDFTFINTLDSRTIQPSMVGYIIQNQMDYLNIPDLPYNHVQMDAVLTYRGVSPKLRLQIFAAAQRPDCPVIQSTLPQYNEPIEALLCDGPGGGVVVSEVVLTPNTEVPIHLQDGVLDEALQKRQLYLGVRLLEGKSSPEEFVEVTQIRINSRL